MNEDLIRTNLVLTKKLRKAFVIEANKTCGGKKSMLIRKILGERYKLPYKLPTEMEGE